jgi:protein SCO1
MLARRALQILTGILLGFALVALVVLLTPPPSSQVEWAGASPPPAPYPAPDLELEDLEGNRVNLASFRGRTTVVFFGYSNCPDVCPATLLNLSGALDRMSARDQDRLQVVFVTLDPERDTRERLRDWMENFHPSIVTLRGDREETWMQASRWGVHASITPVTAPATGEPGDHGEHGATGEHAAHGEPETRADAPPQQPEHEAHAGHDEDTAQADPHAAHLHDAGPWGFPEGLDALVPAGAPGAYFVDHSTRSFVLDRQGRVVLFLAPFQGAEAMAEDLARIIR